ncbi:MAG: hypothetical protein Q7R34_17045 [Dehalococcoidia bacterium]|nr:hypothetical protein [Dehalococcoidia bacterium]
MRNKDAIIPGRITALKYLLALVLITAVAACTQEPKSTPAIPAKNTPTPTVSATPAPTASPTQSRPTVSPTPTATPTPIRPATSPSPAATAAPTASFTFKNELIAFDYGTAWRLSGTSENSVTLGLKEKPGDVFLSVKWLPSDQSRSSDVHRLYEERLGMVAREVKRLDDITIGNITATRYAGLIRKGNQSVVTLNALFQSGSVLYMATYTANSMDFPAYSAEADRVIKSLRVP